MTHEELIQSPEYWTTKAQLDLYQKVEEYMETEGINRKELAKRLGVSKGYVTQILNGDYDHRLSKFVELSINCGFKPIIRFESIDEYKKDEEISEFIRKTCKECSDRGVIALIMRNAKDNIKTCDLDFDTQQSA